MDKTGWQTHCFGRFLVDLPLTAKIVPTYKIDGDEIKRISGTPEALAARIAQREQQLKSEKHETQGNMFVRRTTFESGSFSLLSWGMPYSTIMYLQEAYFMTPQKKIYVYNGDVAPDREPIALQFTAGLANHLVDLNPTQVPTGPGFCIDGAFIAGGEYRVESFDIGITLPEHPGMTLSLLVTTQGQLDDDNLIERALTTQAALIAQGATLLRMGGHSVGPIPAHEYLMTDIEEGQRIYAFTWEATGKVNSIAEPYMTAELQVQEQNVVDEEHPYNPAFRSDDQAVQLWDAIIDSIRLRPGAV